MKTLFNELSLYFNPEWKSEDFSKIPQITHRFEKNGKTLHHNSLTTSEWWIGDGDDCSHLSIYREVHFRPSINWIISEAKVLAEKYPKIQNAFQWLSDNPHFDEWDMKNKPVETGKSEIDWNLGTVQHLAEWLTVSHKEVVVSHEPRQWYKK